MASVIDSSLSFASPNVVSQLNYRSRSRSRSRPHTSISITRTLFPLKLISASPFKLPSPSMKKLCSFTIDSYLPEPEHEPEPEAENTKTQNKLPLKFAEVVKSSPSIFENKVSEIQTLTFHQLSTVRKEMNSLSTRTHAPLKDKLDQFEILKYPLATESAMKNILENNTLVFIVDARANKKNIRDAFENMFKIPTKKVNTLLYCDGTKKAYVMLTPDYKALDVAKKIKVI